MLKDTCYTMSVNVPREERAKACSVINQDRHSMVSPVRGVVINVWRLHSLMIVLSKLTVQSGILAPWETIGPDHHEGSSKKKKERDGAGCQ